MLSQDLLRRLRNDLPMSYTIGALGRHGPPSKMSDGYFRFLCPHCGEMRATVNPKNNLAHCFCCKKNLNNIDLLLKLDYPFLNVLYLALIAFSGGCCRIVIRLSDVCYTRNLANRTASL